MKFYNKIKVCSNELGDISYCHTGLGGLGEARGISQQIRCASTWNCPGRVEAGHCMVTHLKFLQDLIMISKAADGRKFGELHFSMDK